MNWKCTITDSMPSRNCEDAIIIIGIIYRPLNNTKNICGCDSGLKISIQFIKIHTNGLDYDNVEQESIKAEDILSYEINCRTHREQTNTSELSNEEVISSIDDCTYDLMSIYYWATLTVPDRITIH